MKPGTWFLSGTDSDQYEDGTRWDILEVPATGDITNAKPIELDVSYDFGKRVVDEHNRVRAFIRDRQQYVEAAKQQRGHEAMGDYLRWQGHMESRRQLAQKLNLPYEFGTLA